MTTRREEMAEYLGGPEHDSCAFKIVDQEFYIDQLKAEITRLRRQVETMVTDLDVISIRAQGVARDARSIVGETR